MFFLTPLLLVSLSSLQASAQLAGQTAQLVTVVANPDAPVCLTATSDADGAPVVVSSCSNATALNSWNFPQGENNVGPIQIFSNKCLDVTGGSDANGAKLQVWTCDAFNANQKWIPSGQDNVITWADKNKCIDLTDGSLTDGTQAQIWDCDAHNNNQKWNHKAVSQVKSFAIQLKKDPSLCVAASAPASGASIVIENCSFGSTSQTFTDPNNNSPGLLKLFDMCVSIDSTEAARDGDKLVLKECDENLNNSKQQWNHENGVLVKSLTSAHVCLDLTDGNASSGTPLQIWDCSSEASTGAFQNDNQEWIVRNTF
ncbi:ricin B lectin domain-containing protein [Favolaschia claudopus]|uniref:Ricin B lectin domain-containing protein n=1 Tax=Favolaschia claudopus TaxID=2862362 RepID=A0AAW0B8J5_9AGAR